VTTLQPSNPEKRTASCSNCQQKVNVTFFWRSACFFFFLSVIPPTWSHLSCNFMIPDFPGGLDCMTRQREAFDEVFPPLCPVTLRTPGSPSIRFFLFACLGKAPGPQTMVFFLIRARFFFYLREIVSPQ